MPKNKQGKKHIHILDGMSLYTRDKSPFYWGYLNVEGEIHKKSLKTTDKKDAEKLLFDWKNELLYKGKKMTQMRIHKWMNQINLKLITQEEKL